MSEDESTATIRPRESSVKGGEHIFLSFQNPVPEVQVFLVFRGSKERHEVPTERHHATPCVLQAIIPAHKLAEVVDLSVCFLDENGEQTTLYSTKFAYTVDEKQFMAELLIQSIMETGVPLQYSILPPLTSSEALRGFDSSLKEALEATELPEGWTLVGYGKDPVMSVEACSPRETLLHFAARHSFTSLAQHLLHLPGAEIAAKLPNETGELPLDLARENENEGLAQLLTLFINSSNGFLSPEHVPGTVSSVPPSTLVELVEEREAEAAMGTEGLPKRRKRELEHFKQINEEWITKVKRRRSSSVSMGQVEQLLNTRNSSISPPPSSGPNPALSSSESHPQAPPSSAIPQRARRKTVAVMEQTAQELGMVPLTLHVMGTSPIPFDAIVINVMDPTLAEMERQRKVSWSRVVGTCGSRSIGTGLNELDRIIAEDTLQQKVAEVQSELEYHQVLRQRRGSVHENGEADLDSHLCLDQSQLNLLYRLSASCPSLNEDSELDTTTPSVDLSVSITPGANSPSSEDGRSVELTEASSPVLDSLLHLPPSLPQTKSQSDSIFSRTDTYSSTGSQPLRSESAPNPPIITTTEYTDNSAAEEYSTPDEDVRAEQSRRAGTQGNGNANNSECVAADLGLFSASASALEMADSLGGGEDEDESTNFLTTMSTPNLQLLPEVRCEDAGDEKVTDDDTSRTEPVTEENGDSVSPDARQMRRESPDRHEATCEGNETSLDPERSRLSKRTSHSVKGVLSTPRVAHDKRGHRRSASTSKLEMMSPSRDFIGRREEDGGEEGDVLSTQSGVWQPTLGSADSIDEDLNSSNLSLERTPMSGAGSFREDDRSRASSMLSSMQEDASDTSDEDTSVSLHSAQGSPRRTSYASLDPLHTLSMNSQEEDLSATSEGIHQKLKSSSSSSCSSNSKDEGDGVVLRRSRRSLTTAAAVNHSSYSADLQLTRIDDVLDNSSEGELEHSSSNPTLSHSYEVQPQTSGTPTNSFQTSVSGGSSSSPGCKKSSVDSTFASEGYLTPSEVDVKFDSDDQSSSVSRSLESSLDQVQPLQPQYRKDARSSPSRSPKISKRYPRSPLFSRRKTITSAESSKENSPTLKPKSHTSKKPKPLTKDEVTPTIQALRNLMGSPDLKDSDAWSVDSDSTISAEHSTDTRGPERSVRTSSLVIPSKTPLERTGSAVSDSIMFASSKGGRASTEMMAASRTASSEALREDSSTLDFVSPGSQSPRVAVKLQNRGEPSKPHPPSPLSLSRSKSPTLPTSPLQGQLTTSHSSPGHTGTDHEGHHHRSHSSQSSFSSQSSIVRVASGTTMHDPLGNAVGLRHLHPPLLTQGSRAMSVDALYKRLESAEPQLGKTIEEEPEGELESSLDQLGPRDDRLISTSLEGTETCSLLEFPADQPSKSSWKNLLRGEFIRSSKHNKKGKRTTEAVRPKAAKARPKVTDITFEEPKANTVELTPPPQSAIPESDIRRSETIQIHSSGKARKLLGINEDHESDSSVPPSPSKGTLQDPPLNASLGGESGPSMPRRERSHTTPVTSSAPTDLPPGSDSGEDDPQVTEHLFRSLSVSHPELDVEDDLAWDKTVNRKLYRKMNRVERERQAVIHELIQTERHHQRALNVLKLIFRDNISELVSEETLGRMFPELDNLIDVSKGFLTKLEARKHLGEPIVDDISDILLEEYSGENREKMKLAFGHFCSFHLEAVEHYKDQLRKKNFSQLMKKLHNHKACNRLTLPDYYTQISQRLAKLVTLLQRLVKKTDSMKLDHAPVLRESWKSLQGLVTSVDKMVEDYKNKVEAMDIQSRLEISVPRSAKNCNRKEIKSLSLTAQDRRLRKRGDAVWKGAGHGRQLAVHVVLMSDLVVLLTERDQKYHLAALQDLKPPVIRLYDLHVRLNAAVKSLVQLLLLEQGEHPEMFRLEFLTKREAREWESALNAAVEDCKTKGVKCEYFGEERVISGDEERRSEEKEGDSDQEGEPPQESQSLPATKLSPDTSPSLRRVLRATESLDFATRILSTTSSITTTDNSSTNRHTGAASAALVSSKAFRSSPKDGPSTNQRPKTTYFEPGSEPGDTALPSSGSKPPKAKPHKKSRIERSKTFKKDEKDRGGGAEARMMEQQYLRCITNLKESLEEMLNDNQEKDGTIAQLREEIKSLRESMSSPEGRDRRGEQELLALVQRSGRRTSSSRGSPQQRPHSVYFERTLDEDTDTDLADAGAVAATEENTDTGT